MTDVSVCRIDELPEDSFIEAMRACCGSSAWCRKMLGRRPMKDVAGIHRAADSAFEELADSDWREAFQCHPRIGDLDSLRMKFAGNEKWSHGEQSGIQSAGDDVIEQLAVANDAYFDRFGYIFIICATGKSADEMLQAVQKRLTHDAKQELIVASEEQIKITHLRLDRLIAEYHPPRDH